MGQPDAARSDADLVGATEATVATAELAGEARRLFFAAQAERHAENPAERPDSGPAGE